MRTLNQVAMKIRPQSP